MTFDIAVRYSDTSTTQYLDGHYKEQIIPGSFFPTAPANTAYSADYRTNVLELSVTEGRQHTGDGCTSSSFGVAGLSDVVGAPVSTSWSSGEIVIGVLSAARATFSGFPAPRVTNPSPGASLGPATSEWRGTQRDTVVRSATMAIRPVAHTEWSGAFSLLPIWNAPNRCTPFPRIARPISRRSTSATRIVEALSRIQRRPGISTGSQATLTPIRILGSTYGTTARMLPIPLRPTETWMELVTPARLGRRSPRASWSGGANLVELLDGTASFAPTGITQWRWTFGDGTRPFGLRPQP